MKLAIEHTIAVVAILFLSVFLATGLSGCSEQPEEAEVSYPDAVVFDFDEIKERGTIRMLTRYNSSSYFLHRGMDRGFEFELVSRFAKDHGLKVEVVLLGIDDDPITLLNQGEGDLIASNYAITPDRTPHIAFSKPYNFVNQVLVQPEGEALVEDVSGLEGKTVSVRRTSSYYTTLKSLQEQGLDITIEEVGEDWNTEALIHEVAEGRMQATVSDDNLFRVASNYIEGVQAGLVLAEQDTVAWAIRKNAPQLKEEMDAFMTDHFRIRESDGRMLRSAFLNILRRRYFEDEKQA
ncbi:MAG: transporter substrate-binding domain-containing protein, partial [Bacteroidota bacterium]